jgi:hypothetical protein
MQRFLLHRDRIWRGLVPELAYRRWLTAGRSEHSSGQIVLRDWFFAFRKLGAAARANALGQRQVLLIGAMASLDVIADHTARRIAELLP